MLDVGSVLGWPDHCWGGRTIAGGASGIGEPVHVSIHSVQSGCSKCSSFCSELNMEGMCIWNKTFLSNSVHQLKHAFETKTK